MSDYGEQGATPVEDAVVDDPPTESEVAAAQRRDHPEQAPPPPPPQQWLDGDACAAVLDGIEHPPGQ